MGPAGAACEGHVNPVVHAISNALDEADSNFGFDESKPSRRLPRILTAVLVRPVAIDKCLAESPPPHFELLERISILDSTVSTNHFGHDLFRQSDKMVTDDLMFAKPGRILDFFCCAQQRR